ncbi:MAG: NAD(P)H-dependent oxidoreductase subunit E [Nocardioides sp.]
MTTSADTPRADVVRALADARTHLRGALLPILHAVMDECGFIDRADLPIIADVLNLSVAEVYGVVSFYHDFSTTPPADHSIVLCRAEACQAVGGQALFDDTRSRAATNRWGASVAVREVFCLGNCALGPAGTIDGRLYGRLNSGAIDRLTASWTTHDNDLVRRGME